MAHYEQIGRKSVVNSLLCPRKPNKIKGLVVQGLQCRKAFLGILSYSKTYCFILINMLFFTRVFYNFLSYSALFWAKDVRKEVREVNLFDLLLPAMQDMRF